MKFNKKNEASGQISTASMPDIVFMLLFFFMVTTVLRQFNGLAVELPEAEMVEKIESRRHTSYLWIARDGQWSFNDVPVQEPRELYEMAYARRVANPQIIVSLKYDKRVEMGEINKAQNELRKADALKVNFSTRLKVR